VLRISHVLQLRITTTYVLEPSTRAVISPPLRTPELIHGDLSTFNFYPLDAATFVPSSHVAKTASSVSSDPLLPPTLQIIARSPQRSYPYPPPTARPEFIPQQPPYVISQPVLNRPPATLLTST